MKVLVTDFDGTLCITHSDEIDVASNICALKRFKKDNIIVLSTARKPESIMKYIKLYDIPCDYVISYMGALIWDCTAEKYIYRKYFSSEDATQILSMIKPYLSEVDLEIYSDVAMESDDVAAPRGESEIGDSAYSAAQNQPDSRFRTPFGGECGRREG